MEKTANAPNAIIAREAVAMLATPALCLAARAFAGVKAGITAACDVLEPIIKAMQHRANNRAKESAARVRFR